jgi:uncharacterized membrane protein SirB2
LNRAACNPDSWRTDLSDFAASYSAMKFVHVSCVLLSISLFMLRGVLQLQLRPWRQWRWLRLLPHMVDTLLLASALWLAWHSNQFPFVNCWLTAKFVALLFYIFLGHLALGRRTPEPRRLSYFVAALLSVGYVVGVALTRSPSWNLSV